MAIKSKSKKPTHIHIDLTGPDGNAFVLLSYAKSIGKSLKFDSSKIDEILLEMKSSDYDNLITVFDKYFGKIVTLYK